MGSSPEPLGHHGWVGISDPMPRATFRDGCRTAEAVKTLQWHHHQAHQRALQAWAADPRRMAWMPCMGKVTYLPEAFDPAVDVRARIHLTPYMLHPDWAVPAHPPTWLVECVDGPVGGAMHTIPWPDDEKMPPATRKLRDPAGGQDLVYYLRDTDLINGIARYTAVHVIEDARIYEVFVYDEPTGGEQR